MVKSNVSVSGFSNTRAFLIGTFFVGIFMVALRKLSCNYIRDVNSSLTSSKGSI